MTHDELVEMGRKWLSNPWQNAGTGGHSACSLVLSELTAYTTYGEIPDVIGWHGNGSTLIECKASRADFRADVKKYFRKHVNCGIGTQRYYIAPKGMINIEDLPSGWGLITVTNGRTRVAKSSDNFESHEKSEIAMLLSLIRRLKIKSGKHVAIRAYTIYTDKEPRATVTLNTDIQAPTDMDGYLEELSGGHVALLDQNEEG